MASKETTEYLAFLSPSAPPPPPNVISCKMNHAYQGFMASKETTEYLAFGPSVNLRKLFGFDPSPEKTKQVDTSVRR